MHDIQQLAKNSGLSVAEVEQKIAEHQVFHQEYAFDGTPEGPGEWVDASSTEFVAIGMGYWGKGADLAEAKANFRKFGGRLSDGYMVLEFGPGSEFSGVSGMGYYHWHGEAPTVTEVPARRKAASR